MSKLPSFDFVSTQLCGCKVTFRAEDDYRRHEMVCCKKHAELNNYNGRGEVLTRASEQLEELVTGKPVSIPLGEVVDQSEA